MKLFDSDLLDKTRIFTCWKKSGEETPKKLKYTKDVGVNFIEKCYAIDLKTIQNG